VRSSQDIPPFPAVTSSYLELSPKCSTAKYQLKHIKLYLKSCFAFEKSLLPQRHPHPDTP